MADEQKCVICGQNASVSSSENFGIINECEHCGGKVLFGFEAENFLKGTNGNKFKACLYYYFTHYKKDNGKVYRISDVNDDECNTVSVNEIMSLYPRNISERIDMILQNFVAISKFIGYQINFIDNEPESYAHIFFIDNLDHADAERDSILKMMDNQKLIHIIIHYAGNRVIINIDFNGWERIDELNKIDSLHGQGFIAMMFDESLKEIREAIEKGISNAGYIPQIINKRQYNGQVVPEILYQIRMSDFLVADLTGNRGGVYYEAGYALGLKKEVIFTVNQELLNKSGKINEPHFDVAQYNQIRYSTPEELTERLFERIIATVGDRRSKLK